MKLNRAVLATAICGAFLGANAHDFWVLGSNADKFSADIGYGHDFPKAEVIPDKRVKLFNPLYIVDKNGGKKVLKQSGENYHFETDRLKNGSYILAGEYKPTFWSKDIDGKWHMDGTRDSVSNVESCQLASMNAKTIIIVGDKKDEFIHTPIGHKVEIVPVDDPSEFRVDKPFKVQVFLDKKPLKTAKVTGTFDGFLKDKHAFYGTTDLNGIIDVLALRAGKWMLKVTHEIDFADKTKCDKEKISATLTFDVR